MKPRLLFATTNAGKVKELRGLVGDAVEVVSLQELPPIPEPVEDGDTFEANAEKKARAYAEASGLCVDALGSRPGVLSARYAEGDDRARYQKLLGELEGLPEAQRTASFRCALCLALPGGEARTEVGRCEGRILTRARGEHGFGYDPVFFFPPLGKTMAELTPEEKARVSHRGAAFRKMAPVLLGLLAGR